MDASESMKLQLYEQFGGDSSWLKVDTQALEIETYLHEEGNGLFLQSLDERTKNCGFGESTIFKSLCHREYRTSEFVFDLTAVPEIHLDSTCIISSVSSLPFIYFPHRILSEGFVGYRERARGHRRQFLQEKEERLKREKEQQEQKRKQVMEIQQKQKDLLQIALKRAQNKKTQIAPHGTPPTPPLNVWSSAAARPSPPPLMMPPPQGGPFTWSSRPMLPPALPPGWPIPVHVPVQDPWSSAAASWSSEIPPAAKKPKPDDGEIQRQRMARLGVPFK